MALPTGPAAGTPAMNSWPTPCASLIAASTAARPEPPATAAGAGTAPAAEPPGAPARFRATAAAAAIATRRGAYQFITMITSVPPTSLTAVPATLEANGPLAVAQRALRAVVPLSLVREPAKRGAKIRPAKHDRYGPFWPARFTPVRRQ